MRRRTALLVTVISTAGLGAGAALASAGAADTSGPPTGTKELVLRQSSFKFLDHPPLRRGDVPPSPGDTSIIGHRVLDTAGHRIGRFSTVCVSTDRRGQAMQCTAAVTLADGTILLEGAGNEVAITGGTGAYAGARGTAEGHEHHRRPMLTLTFMP